MHLCTTLGRFIYTKSKSNSLGLFSIHKHAVDLISISTIDESTCQEIRMNNLTPSYERGEEISAVMKCFSIQK